MSDTQTEQAISKIEEALGYPAFRGFISFAWDSLEMRRAFTDDTGMVWPDDPPKGLRIAAQPQPAEGASHAEAFLMWAVKTHWGPDLIPNELRQKVFGDPRP